MKIILLSGESGAGKSTALHRLFNILSENGTKNVIKKEFINKKDPCSDADYIVKYNKKEIAIVTYGDILWKCIKSIIEYANLDVLVLAYNNRFSIGLDKMVSKYDYHCLIKKSKPNEDDCVFVCNEIITKL